MEKKRAIYSILEGDHSEYLSIHICYVNEENQRATMMRIALLAFDFKIVFQMEYYINELDALCLVLTDENDRIIGQIVPNEE